MKMPVLSLCMGYKSMEKYVFKPYNPIWPKLFMRECERIKRNIFWAINIEHIGSTAVPGLGGKGIIDIAIAAGKEDLERTAKVLQEFLGYVFRESGSTIERLFFRIDLPDEEEGMRRYHVHLSFAESSEWRDLILFRDYLRDHSEEVQRYAELKKDLVDQVRGDGGLYRKHKAPFFEEVLKKAQKGWG